MVNTILLIIERFALALIVGGGVIMAACVRITNSFDRIFLQFQCC